MGSSGGEGGGGGGGGGADTVHRDDTIDAHDASAISVDSGLIVNSAAVEVQATLGDFDTLLSTHTSDIAGKAASAHTHDDLYVKETSGGQEPLVTASDTGAVTISLATGNNHTRTLTGTVTYTFPFGLGTGYNAFRLRTIQDATGGRVITWPGAITWATGAAPVLDTTPANDEELFFETEDGGTTWLGHHLTARAIPQVITLFADSTTWTDMPAALTEFSAGNLRHRAKVDLSRARQTRITVRVTNAGGGSTNAKIRAEYSTDETTWDYLDGVSGPSVSIDVGPQTAVSSWVDLAVAAKADVFVRFVGIDGDGVVDPTFGTITLQVQ